MNVNMFPVYRSSSLLTLVGIATAFLLVVLLLSIDYYGIYEVSAVLFILVAVIPSISGAVFVGWQNDGLLLAWLVTGIPIAPIVWVLGLGGPPGQKFGIIDTIGITLRITIPYSIASGTLLFSIGLIIYNLYK